MINYIKLKDGVVVQLGRGPALPEGFIEVPPSIPLSSLEGKMLENGQWVPRPMSSVPEEIGGGWEVTGCPTGTIIQIYDVAGAEMMAEVVADQDDFSQSFSLPDPGLYEVVVRFPSPYRSSKTRIEVDHVETEPQP